MLLSCCDTARSNASVVAGCSICSSISLGRMIEEVACKFCMTVFKVAYSEDPSTIVLPFIGEAHTKPAANRSR